MYLRSEPGLCDNTLLGTVYIIMLGTVYIIMTQGSILTFMVRAKEWAQALIHSHLCCLIVSMLALKY